MGSTWQLVVDCTFWSGFWLRFLSKICGVNISISSSSVTYTQNLLFWVLLNNFSLTLIITQAKKTNFGLLWFWILSSRRPSFSNFLNVHKDTSLTLTIAMLECYHLQIKKERSPLSSCRTMKVSILSKLPTLLHILMLWDSLYPWNFHPNFMPSQYSSCCLSAGNAVNAQQWLQYAKQCVEPGLTYFHEKFTEKLSASVAAFEAAWLFLPCKISKIQIPPWLTHCVYFHSWMTTLFCISEARAAIAHGQSCWCC